VGDWYLGNDNRWHYDKDAPSPGQQPAVTMMHPVVPRDEPEDDGHVNPAEFPRFDGINSLMIRSIDAPD
jgi:hypothetical protein